MSLQIPPSDMIRRLDNLLRLGTIAEVDHANALVRVQSGEILTNWLPWLTFRAGSSQTWSPPTPNEQCLVLAVSGELTTAVVLTGIYTQNAPNHSRLSNSPDEHCFLFADGAEVKYNQASGQLSATNCKTAIIQASESITADSPHFTCTGDVVIAGKLSVTGAISSQSSVTAQGEVSGKGINLSTHTHAGVETGNKRTGTP